MKDVNVWGMIDDALDFAGLERKSSGGGFGSFLFGMGCGLIAGGAAALLLAPAPGTETREKLLRAGEDLSRNVSGKVDEWTKQIKGDQGEQFSSTSSYGQPVGTRAGI